MATSVNILIAGDDSAGKTSLINTFISSTFSEEATPGNLEIKIPQESVLYKKNVHILDSHENSAQLDLQLRKTDCVVILADCSQASSLNAIVSYWLPRVRDVFAASSSATPAPDSADNPSAKNKTAIIALSKSDLLSAEAMDALLDGDRWTAVFKEYPFVACITSCSAKALSVQAVIDMAARLASYPIWPLYDVERQRCRPEMWRAFKRIFRIHDRDMDGLLSDSELNSFQRNCDWEIIKREELLAIKRMIQHSFNSDSNDSGGSHRGAFSSAVPVHSMIQIGADQDMPASDLAHKEAKEDKISRPHPSPRIGVINDRLTFDGFFSLIVEVTCRDLNLAIPWTALHIFNYDDELELQLPRGLSDVPVVPANSTLCLSQAAVDFLAALVTNSCNRAESSGSDTPLGSTLHHSYDSEPEYCKKICDVASVSHPFSVPAFLAEALSVLSDSDVHPWKATDSIDQTPIGSPVIQTPKSPSPKEPRLNKANLQRAVANGSNINISMKVSGTPIATAKSEARRGDVKLKSSATKIIEGIRRLPPYLLEGTRETKCTYLGCMRERVAWQAHRPDVHDLIVHWLAQWQALAPHNPVLVQTLLFRLGYVGKDRGLAVVPGNARMRCTLAAQAKASGLSRISRGHSSTYSTHVGVVVLGGESVDAHKYGLVTAISDLNLSNDNILAGGADHGSAGSIYVNDAPTGSRIGITEEPGLKLPTASFDEIKYGTEHTVSGGCHVYTSDPTAGCQISWHKPRGTHTLSPFTSLASTFVIVDAVPALHFDDWRQNKKNPLPDIALLLYAQGDDVSLNSVLKMEKLLPNSMSRLFLEVKSEMSISIAASEMVRSKAAAIAADVGLHVPVHLITTGPISFNASAVRDLVEQCVRVAMDVDERGVPLPYRGRRRSVVLDNLIKGIGVSVLLSLSTYAYLRYPGGLMGLCGALSREFINPAFLQVGVIFRNCIAATRRSTILLVQMCRDGLSGLLPSRPSQQLR